jgi:MFS family permease
MITMPIAGFLADKIGPGKVVLTGIVLDTVGMGMLIVVDAHTSYSYIITAFVIMGLGMGSTMMPVFTAALASLRDHDIARGSTLMNITQQIAISMGTALFSVLLTNSYNQHRSVSFTLAVQNAAGDHTKIAAILQQFHIPADRLQALYNTGLDYMGQSFGDVFLVATVLVGLCLVPAFFLPRKPVKHRADEVDQAAMI